MPVTLPQWSTPVADVQRRLSKLGDVLTQARRPDGSVDLKQAKALAGRDVKLADLVQAVRTRWTETTLSPAEARRAFLELQTAVQTAKDYDADHDARLGYRELPFFDTHDDPARRLVFRAAAPLDTTDGRTARPRVALSREARAEAEEVITRTALFHAKTPLGAEALKWDMRLRVLEGYDVRGGVVFDAVNFSESDWRAKLPLVGRRWRGEGHLSDAELTKRFGDLATFVEKTKAQVNARVMMDYATEWLPGKDLP